MQSSRFHVIIDLDYCQKERMIDVLGIEVFLKNIVVAIKMNILKGPVVAEGVPINPGLSAFVIIDTSHCSIHTSSQYNETMIDIFSCKEFDINEAMRMAKKYFATELSEIRHRKIWWGA